MGSAALQKVAWTSLVDQPDTGMQDGEESTTSRSGWTLPSRLLAQAGRLVGRGLQVKMVSEVLAY